MKGKPAGKTWLWTASPEIWNLRGRDRENLTLSRDLRELRMLPTSYLLAQAAAGQLHQSGLPSLGGSMTLGHARLAS